MTRAQRRGMRKLSWGYAQDRVIRKRLPLRCLWLIVGLKRWHQAVHMPRLYIGDTKLAGRQFAKCSESSIYRAKRDLEQLHIIAVTRTVGGSTRNPAGEVVAAATGYELHPDLYALTAEDRQARTPPAARVKQAEQLRAQTAETLAAIRTRAGP